MIDETARAIAGAIGHSLTPGKVFAHPSDPIVHSLEKIEDGRAIGRSITGESVSFPASECYDPNVAVAIGRSLQKPRVILI